MKKANKASVSTLVRVSQVINLACASRSGARKNKTQTKVVRSIIRDPDPAIQWSVD